MDASIRTAEWLEQQGFISLHETCSTECRQALGLELVYVGDAVVSIATLEPSILLNRAMGLGFGMRANVDDVAAVIHEYECRGVRDYFLQLNRDDVDVSDEQLAELGLERARGWQRFERGLQPPGPAESELRVRELNTNDAREVEAFGVVVAESFGLHANAAPLFSGAVNSDLWTLFASFDGNTLVGTGALLVSRDPHLGELCGWLDMGATVPTFRRRGGQLAVMATRIHAALEAGCTRLFTQTGKAVPGDPQHSYKNIVKSGFRECSVKENWRPKKA